MQQGICNPEFYGDLLNKLKNIIGNNSKKFRSFKSKENIHKKEVGSYHGFGY